MLVVTIQFTSVRMCVCLYGYVFVCFLHVNTVLVQYVICEMYNIGML